MSDREDMLPFIGLKIENAFTKQELERCARGGGTVHTLLINALKLKDVVYVRELVQMQERDVRSGMGPKTFKILKKVLARHGLRFGMMFA